MSQDRISELRAEGLRVFERVRLGLDGLTVVIGDNGTGKSTLIEAFELLRRAGYPEFLQELSTVHGGLRSLRRFGSPVLRLGARIEGPNEQPLDYEISLGEEGERTVIVEEKLCLGPTAGHADPLIVIQRTRGSAKVFDRSLRKLVDVDVPADRHLLAAFGLLPPQPAIARAALALRRIRVHVPFDVTPRWVANATPTRRPSPLRNAAVIEPATKLERGAVNLANVFHALKNDVAAAHWEETMDYVRLGLGDHVRSVNTRVDPAGGAIALQLELDGVEEQVPAWALSDGMLAYLAFVALFRLRDEQTLVAFDEPELHLHPKLLMRVLGMFETMAESRPVLLATHSDRLLDGLRKPECAVLTTTDGTRAALLRPDPDSLQAFLREYRGLGDIRNEGHEQSVMSKAEPD